jgi:hypothetical protein
MSWELDNFSNARKVVTAALNESVGLQLDALFDASAGTAIRPGGLRFDVTALTKSSATDAKEAMIADLTTLSSAVSGVA